MVSGHSKLIGSLVGGALGLAVSRFGLPAEWASPEVVAAITTLASVAFTYWAPANQPVSVVSRSSAR